MIWTQTNRFLNSSSLCDHVKKKKKSVPCDMSMHSLPLVGTVQTCGLSWLGWDVDMPAFSWYSIHVLCWSVCRPVSNIVECHCGFLFSLLLFFFNYYFSSCCCPVTPAPMSTATLLWPSVCIQVKTVFFLLLLDRLPLLCCLHCCLASPGFTSFGRCWWLLNLVVLARLQLEFECLWREFREEIGFECTLIK